MTAPTRAEVEALLPCPFCGAVEGVVYSEQTHPSCGIARCSNCNATHACNTEAEAIRRWNRRAYAATLDVPVVEAQKAPLGEQACYDLGYANPSKSIREYQWAHLVCVNAYTAGQADYQNQAPRNSAYDRDQYDPDTFERLTPQATPVAEGKPDFEALTHGLFQDFSGRASTADIIGIAARTWTAAAHKAALEAEARVAEMREALKPFTEIALLRDERPGDIDIIDAPDLAITPNQVRAARRVLTALSSDRFMALLEARVVEMREEAAREAECAYQQYQPAYAGQRIRALPSPTGDRFMRLLTAAQERKKAGHNDTCEKELLSDDPMASCSCGHDALCEALSLFPQPEEQP